MHVVASISTVFEEEMVTWDLHFPLVRRKEMTQRAIDVIEYEDVDLDSQEKVPTTRILCLGGSAITALGNQTRTHEAHSSVSRG